MDITFSIKDLGIEYTMNVYVLLPIVLGIIAYIGISAFFIISFTRGFYKREYTLGLPYGIVIKGSLDEDSALNHLNKKLIKAEKENSKISRVLIIATILIFLNNRKEKPRKIYSSIDKEDENDIQDI